MRKVIGLFGLIGSGKDAVSEYLSSKHGYTIIIMGDILRETSKSIGRTENRDDLQLTQKEFTEKYGMDYFANKVVEKIIENNLDKVVINGIRRPPDVAVPKKHFGKEMIFVLINASPRIRFERMKKRARTGDPETFEEFQRQEENEFRFFDLEGTMKLVEHKITNNSTLEDLYEKIDDLLQRTGFL